MKVFEMLKMLAEILSIDENNIEFIEDNNEEKLPEYPEILKFNTYQKYLS